MKKTFLFAAFAALCMTSCMNEEFPNAPQVSEKGYGYINLNVSNDPIMQTRAPKEVTDLNGWIVKATDGSEEITLTTASTKVKAGTYTVYARNYETESAWMEENDNWGDAYYEGDVEVNVVAGQTTSANIDCGTAKNARLKVQFSLISNFTEYSLKAKRNLVFNSENAATALAYYAAEEEVDYTFYYTYIDTPKEITGKITMGDAATENIISIASNDNGTISVTVKYDDTFGEGNSQTLVFDAATGDEVKN